MATRMTKTEITHRLDRMESEIQVLRSQLKSGARTPKKRPFIKLRGIWKKYGDFTYEEIKAAEIGLPNEP